MCHSPGPQLFVSLEAFDSVFAWQDRTCTTSWTHSVSSPSGGTKCMSTRAWLVSMIVGHRWCSQPGLLPRQLLSLARLLPGTMLWHHRHESILAWLFWTLSVPRGSSSSSSFSSFSSVSEIPSPFGLCCETSGGTCTALSRICLQLSHTANSPKRGGVWPLQPPVKSGPAVSLFQSEGLWL